MQDMEFGGLIMPARQDQNRFRFGATRSSTGSGSDSSSASSDECSDGEEEEEEEEEDSEMQLELYIQMEYCQNTLREVISSSSSSSSSSGSNEHTKKLQIMRQITEALEYLHASGMTAPEWNHKPLLFALSLTILVQALSTET